MRMHSTACTRCLAVFSYLGYTSRPRKFCNDCLPIRKLEVAKENARLPQSIESTRLVGLANKGHSRNVGDKHGAWKGDDVGKDALHFWVIRWKGQPKECEHCGGTSKKTEWANKSQEYRRDLDDWLRLCRSCHLNYDISMGVRSGKR